MKKILVIREVDEFSRILAENDFEIVNLPLIETKTLKNLSDFEAKLKAIEIYDGIFLTSKNAAQILAEKIDELKISFAGKIYVLGRRSFEILKDRNFNLVFYEEANSADEMLGNISIAELKNRKFLYVRGEKSLGTIPNFVGRVAAIDETIVYANEPVHLELDQIAQVVESFEKNEFEAICFFSPSAAENFNAMFDAQILHQTKIAVIGKTTAEFWERQKLRLDFVSPKSSAEHFAVELAKYLRGN